MLIWAANVKHLTLIIRAYGSLSNYMCSFTWTFPPRAHPRLRKFTRNIIQIRPALDFAKNYGNFCYRLRPTRFHIHSLARTSRVHSRAVIKSVSNHTPHHWEDGMSPKSPRIMRFFLQFKLLLTNCDTKMTSFKHWSKQSNKNESTKMTQN